MARERLPARARPLRIAAAVLLLALGSAPLLEMAHAARVEHVACPRDGELVDAPPSRAQIAHSDARGSVLPSDPLPAREHGHDHCCLAVRARSSARMSAQAPFAAAIAAVLRVAPPTRDAPRPAPFAIYLLAPKISPPSA
jgi:hypothetical protein